MYQKLNQLWGFRILAGILYLVDYKRLAGFGRTNARNRGETKNEGICHDVIENKSSKMDRFWLATMLMKIKELSHRSHDVIDAKAIYGLCPLRIVA